MTRKNDALAEYREKRDTASSGEPPGRRGGGGHDPVFVVQRHDASQLHFDFRLEVDGVLASWSVPKGPSTDPGDKRLAVRTEDHPLDYAGFEGRIDEGYGTGTVIVWDTGRFTNITERDGEEVPLGTALDEGHLSVRLDGSKITGGYSLTRTGTRAGKEQWLLVKRTGEGADRRRRPVTSQPESVLSGRRNEDLEE